MRVGLNATCLNERPSGARQRFLGIYRPLAQQLPDVDFRVYAPADWDPAPWFSHLDNVEIVHTPLPSEGRAKRHLGGMRYWPQRLAQDRLDIFECFHQPLVSNPAGLTVLTVHDIRAAIIGRNVAETFLYAAVLRHDMARADHVLTVSEFMKSEIEARFPGKDVSRLYNGIDVADFRGVSKEQTARFRQKYSLPTKFVLSVGHLERRKNYPRLIEALKVLKDRGRPIFLLIVGNDSGMRQEIAAVISEVGLKDSVRLLSNLSDDDLKCAYHGAELVVFSSFYEGFGIPILEAMAAGTPLALSDIAVFREITEDSANYFDYDDVEEMATAIENTLSSTERRKQIKDYGRKRVKDFDFSNIAGKLSELYCKWL